MASDEIKYSDLVQPGTFEKFTQDGEKLIATFVELEKVIKGAMSGLKGGLSGGITTAADVEKTQQLVEQVSKLENELAKTKKAKEQLTVETAKAKIQQQEFDKAIKQTAKDELGLTTEYQKQSRTLNDMRNRYKDLVLQQKESSKEAKNLLANITQLDAKLKQVDATVGQHQRNVGNYADALNKAKSSVVSIGSAIGVSFGVTELVSFGKEAIDLASKMEGIETAFKKLNRPDLLDNLREATKGTVSDMVLMQTAVKANNFQLPLEQLGTLLKFAQQRAQETGESVEYLTESIVLGISRKSIPILDNLGISSTQVQKEFKKTGDFAKAVGNIVNQSLKEQGDLALTTADKMARLTTVWENFKVEVGKFLIEQGNDLIDFFDAAFGDKTFNEVGVQRALGVYAKGLEETNNKIIAQARESEVERLKLLSESSNKIAKLNDEILKGATGDRLKYIQFTIASERKLNNTLRHLNDVAATELSEEEKKRLDEKRKEKEKALKDDLARQKKMYEEQLKLEKWLEDEKIKAAHKQNKAEMQAQRDADEIIKQMMDEQLQSELDAWDRAKKIQDAKDKQAEEDKKRRADEVADSIETVEKLEQIYFDYYQRINELKRESIENDLDATNKNIEIQAQLAARGLENTLAYEMEKKNQLEKARAEQIEREKKQAQQQEAAQLALAFIKAYENYIGKNMSSGQALSKAATDVLAAKLLSKAIAGAFADGVENFKGDGTGTSDSNLIAFSNGESVVTAKATSETPGLVSALNEKGKLGALEWAMDNVYKPNYNSLGLADVSTKRQTESALMSVLVHELNELKEVVKNKKETTLELDNMGNVIKTTVENGVRKTVKKKTHLS